MYRIIYDKLVRDKIPEILTEKGIKFELIPPDELKPVDILDYAHAKIAEELEEVKRASISTMQTTEELADIIEAVRKIADWHGISYNAIEKKRKAKAKELGTFKNNIILLHTLQEKGEEE